MDWWGWGGGRQKTIRKARALFHDLLLRCSALADPACIPVCPSTIAAEIQKCVHAFGGRGEFLLGENRKKERERSASTLHGMLWLTCKTRPFRAGRPDHTFVVKGHLYQASIRRKLNRANAKRFGGRVGRQTESNPYLGKKRHRQESRSWRDHFDITTSPHLLRLAPNVTFLATCHPKIVRPHRQKKDIKNRLKLEGESFPNRTHTFRLFLCSEPNRFARHSPSSKY